MHHSPYTDYGIQLKERGEHDTIAKLMNKINSVEQVERKLMELFTETAVKKISRKPIMRSDMQISHDLIATSSGDRSAKIIDMQSGCVIKSFDDICNGKCVSS